MSFLGVEASLTGRCWVGPDAATERAAEALTQRASLQPAVAQVLARQGVAPDEVELFMAPALRDLLPDPRSLRDMEKAAARFLAAVEAQSPIAIFADYDVDGGASAALLITWMRHFGLTPTLYIPDRIDEGYGPNEASMTALARDHDLIICVDCGTLSHDALAAARAAEVLVLDHHLGGETLPPAYAVVNPNRQDESGQLSHLCAAGVVFLFLVEVRRQLREANSTGPDLLALLDLVALATVADVAPLKGVNRAFVRQGLTVMGRRARAGLVALADVARLDRAPAAYHLGYVLGPRINAGGRVGAADLGARLLATENPSEAEALAIRLDALNAERREIEASVRAAALAQAEERGYDRALVWAAGADWHPGVVGIVASRLKEASGKPSIVIGLDDGIGKGSGRSVAGIDLGQPIQRLAHEGKLLKGGGHKMAAGLTVAEDQLVEAMAALEQLLEKQGAHHLGAADLRLDGMLMPGAATHELITALEAAGPFGAGAPAPRFAFARMRLGNVRRIGENHLRFSFDDQTAPAIDGICFGAFDSAIGPALNAHGGARFHLAGRLEINSWQGRQRVQLQLEDVASAD
ncbi:MAG: single-stranded-DNA-specific exonuclease RecJ [Pseudomonadota bacterium]